MSPLSHLIRRRFGRFAPLPAGHFDAFLMGREDSEPSETLRQFVTAFAGGFVFFSILIF